MADKKYGIVINAKDNASKAVKKIAETMGTTSNAAKKLGSMGASAFSAFGKAVVVVNQGVELFKSVWGGISGVVTDSIDAMMELRGETTPLAREMRALSTSSKAVKATLGEAFATAMVAVSKGF